MIPWDSKLNLSEMLLGSWLLNILEAIFYT